MNATLSTEVCRTRAWPAPRRPWAIRMIWHDLLFAHWPVNARELREQLPPGIELDTFDGQAWIGVVPFHMSGIRPRGLPPLPWLSAFPELNLRTYVVAEGKPGVWFLTLDATSRFTIAVARRFFHLPYRHARIACRPTRDGWIDFRSERRDRHFPPAKFAARYRPLPRHDCRQRNRVRIRSADELAHRAILPLFGRRSRANLPRRDRSSDLAAGTGRGGHRSKHAGQRARNRASRLRAAAAFQPPHRSGRLDGRAGGDVGKGVRNPFATRTSKRQSESSANRFLTPFPRPNASERI